MADRPQGTPPPPAPGYTAPEQAYGQTQPQPVYPPQGQYPQQVQHPQHQPQAYPPGPAYGTPPQHKGPDFGEQAARFAREHISTPETKEFFKTSEFLLWALGSIGVLIASAVVPDILDAVRAWTLITVLSISYILSRGLAKAFAHRADDVDRPSFAGGDTNAVSQIAHHVSTPETKEFFKTSEFAVWALTLLGIAIASSTNDLLDARGAWNLITAVTAGYLISRGLSKLGTRRDIESRVNRSAGAGTVASYPAAPVGGIQQTPATPGLTGTPATQQGYVDVRQEIQHEDHGYINR